MREVVLNLVLFLVLVYFIKCEEIYIYDINRILFNMGVCGNFCYNNVNFLKLLFFFYKYCVIDFLIMFVMYLSVIRRIRLWIWLKYINRNWV